MAWIRPVVDHIFLVDRGGVPMIHLSRGLPTGADPDLIASMFTAIVDFMNQSFHSMGHGDVRSIELEDYQVLFGRGRNILMLLLYRGWESNRLERRVARGVKALERRHAAVLEHWDGGTDRLVEGRQELEHLWRLRERQDVVEVLRPQPAPVVDAPPVLRQGRAALGISDAGEGAGPGLGRLAHA